MSDAVLQATIKAYDEFTQQFQKFQNELKKTEQAEKQVTATTESVNQVMTNYVQAKTKAREATEKFNKILADLSNVEKRTTVDTEKLNAAFNQMVAAERVVEQENKKLTATLSANGLSAKEAANAIRQTDKALDSLGQQHQQHGQAANNDMIQMLALTTALYTLQRALTEVMSTGREFELAIKQDQAVIGDMTGALRDAAMASQGIQGPTEVAKAYYELGSAGLKTNEVIKATPDILDFATAGLIKMEDSAYAVSSTVKAFALDWSQTTEVVDAFTEAMNSTAMKAEDFKWVMGSAGAVGKMAGQDFKEVVAAVAAMRDAGVQAQDAGTSVKAALLQLINPTKEARDLMKSLGIEIYDSSGNMKQWHEIIAELESALAPYNEESRNLILTTIGTSDGIRALATGMRMGSDKLAEYVTAMGDADGATEKMADTMTDSFDGALRKANATLEKTKVLLFEDFEEGAVGMLGVLYTLTAGFNSLDESGRRVVEMLIGSAGLVVGIGALVGALRVLQPMLATMGITTAALTGPIGLAIMAVTALGAAFLTYKGAQAQAMQQEEAQGQQVLGLAKQYDALTKELATLKDGTDEKKRAQEALNRVIADLGDIMPGIVSQWDSEGRAIALNTEKLRENTAEVLRNRSAKSQENAEDLQRQLQSLYKKKGRLGSVDEFVEQSIKSQKTWNPYLDETAKANIAQGATIEFNQQVREIENQIDNVLSQLRQEYAVLFAEANAYDAGKFRQAGGGAGRTTGTGTYTLPSTGSQNKAADAAKQYIEATTAVLNPYKAATEAAANAVSILAAKEQYLVQVMESGQGTAYQTVELNKVRAQQLATLESQGKALQAENVAQVRVLQTLQQAYSKAHDAKAAKELKAEIDNLTKSITQNSQTWWQVEQQKFSLQEQVKQEEKKRYDDAYSQSMDLMRHEVNMARMSTEQQIEYLQKLRDAHEWNMQQMQSIEEDLYRLRKQQLSEYLSELDDEYKDKLDAIEARTKRATDAIQDQIDALEGEGKASDQEEAARKHNEKLKELEEKRREHELRTGIEHQKALADIDKQIAEEKADFQRQQEEWAREDQKEALQKQIDDAKEAGDEERDELEEHYQKARRIAENGIMDMIASLAATKPEWLETGKDLVDALIEGLESGDFSSVERKIDRIRDSESSPTPEPNIPGPSQGEYSEDPSTMSWQERLVYFKTHIAEAMAEIARAGSVYTADLAAGDITGARAAHRWADQIRKAIGQPLVWDQNTESSASVHNSYDKGGLILYDQIAKVHRGEYVLPANLVDAIRRGTAPPAQASGGSAVIVNINAPLLAPEKLVLSDDMDIKRVGMGLRKEVMALATARGR